jgi:hypothetical protein
MTDNDMQFLIECLSTELAMMLIDDYGWDITKSLDVLYNSKTYAKLNDPKCGLYYEGAVYVYQFLKNELISS